jgi:hypothetical protein
LPDISELNGTAIDNVAEFDGVTVPSAISWSPPLDTYTNAEAGYSVRLLRTAYTGDIMRVRRASDNVEADVGFDSNNEFGLTSPISNTSDAQSYTDFADFVDHTGTPTDAFVRYWYDQSTNANDAGTATESNQPKVYNGGGIVEKNSRPGLLFDFDIFTVGTQITLSGNTHIQSVCEYRLGRLVYGGPSGHFMQIESIGVLNYRGFGADIFGTPTYTANEQGYQTVARDSSNTCRIYYKGTLLDTELNRTATTYFDRIGNGNGTSAGIYDGIFQEIIVWAADQTSNRTGIDSNQNDYFAF